LTSNKIKHFETGSFLINNHYQIIKTIRFKFYKKIFYGGCQYAGGRILVTIGRQVKETPCQTGFNKIQTAKTLVKATYDRLEFKLFMPNVLKNNLVLFLRFGKVFPICLEDRAFLESNPVPARVIEVRDPVNLHEPSAIIRTLT